MQLVHTAAVVTPDHAQVPGDDAVKDRPMCESCETTENQVLAATLSMKKRCYFCGGPYHSRTICPARESTCNKCDKKGRCARACLSKTSASAGKKTMATVFDSSQPSILATVTGVTFPQSLH